MLGKFRKNKLTERGEAMPAAIITAALTSFMLLVMASILSLIVQEKVQAEAAVNLTAIASNIEASFSSDVEDATNIEAEPELSQPTERLLEKGDVSVTSVSLHIPEATGECKVVLWRLDEEDNSIHRGLTIHEKTKRVEELDTCDEESPVIAERVKSFGSEIDITDPLAFDNKVGRDLVFSITPEALETVNIQLEAQLMEKGVDRLSDEELDVLSDNMEPGSFVAIHAAPDACVMNSPKEVWEDENSDGATQDSELHCESPESENVAKAWESTLIAEPSFDFSMVNKETVTK